MIAKLEFIPKKEKQFICKLWIVLHELAHYVHNMKMIDDKLKPWATQQVHGKEFVTIYFNLLSKYFDIDFETLKRSANIHKIEV